MRSIIISTARVNVMKAKNPTNSIMNEPPLSPLLIVLSKKTLASYE